MRLRIFPAAWAALMLVFLNGDGASARDPLLTEAQPKSFEALFTELYKTVPTYLNASQCGGWDANQSAEGTIANVTGMPGHLGQWNGNLYSGMATRNAGTNQAGGFLYPQNTQGLSTACIPNLGGQVQKSVWENGQRVNKMVPYPQFADPVCLNPNDCEEVKNKLNAFTYRDCKTVGPDGQCCQWCERYTCTDTWVDDPTKCQNSCTLCKAVENVQQGALPAACQFPDAEVSTANAVTCAGEQCRCTRTDGISCTLRSAQALGPQLLQAVPAPQIVNGWEVINALGAAPQPMGARRDYRSYFRLYRGGFEREKVNAAPRDTREKEATAACFGFYEEFDPGLRQTAPKDRRCTINIDVSSFRETQNGKGLFASISQPRNPLAANNQRNNGAFDADNDLWMSGFGGAFSLLNARAFQEHYNGNLTEALLNEGSLDTGSLTASPRGARTPIAFDDTGANQSMVRWWNVQETAASALFRPPVIRILLPASLVTQLPPNQRPAGDPRSQTVEIQLGAGPDMLSDTLAYLETALLPLREEPMPVVVPLASPVELRALAGAWCTWHLQRTSDRDCTKAPQQVRDIIARLNEYADAIDNVRTLRGELARYAARLLDAQRNLAAPIGQWLGENTRKYEALMQQHRQLQASLLPKWRSAQEKMTILQSSSNRPWCMNQRFTTPVFSLLDPWLPARAENGSSMEQGQVNQNRLPTLRAMPRAEDLVVDFSNIRTVEGSIAVPVLQPIQVRLDLPRPPAEGAPLPPVPPQLPDVKNIVDAVRSATDRLLPKTDSSHVRPVASSLPDPLPAATLQQISQTLDDMNTTLNIINTRYDSFWKSINPRNGTLACEGWDDTRCQHVEMDLAERLQRIGSRPDVQLKEDLLTVRDERHALTVCMREDPDCSLLPHQRVLPTVEWNTLRQEAGGQAEALNALRASLRDLTMMEPVGDISSSAAPPYDATFEQILPSINIPSPVPLAQ